MPKSDDIKLQLKGAFMKLERAIPKTTSRPVEVWLEGDNLCIKDSFGNITVYQNAYISNVRVDYEGEDNGFIQVEEEDD
jgi:hypothetical protein